MPQHGGEEKARIVFLQVQVRGGGDDEVEPGYEKVEIGPTTNFVGNHMTQAAIDLVQAELQDDYQACGMHALLENEHKPLLELKEKKVVANQLKQAQSIDSYTWVDEGEKIKITLRIYAQDNSIRCSFSSRKVQVSLMDRSGWPHTLILHPLWSEINPELCRWSQYEAKVVIQLTKCQYNAWGQLIQSKDGSMRNPLSTLKHEGDLRKLRKILLNRPKNHSSGPCRSKIEIIEQGRTSSTFSEPSAGNESPGSEDILELAVQGEHFLETGRYSNAREIYERILQTLGEAQDVGKIGLFASTSLNLAQCYLKEGRSSKVLDWCSFLITNSGVDPEARRQAYLYQAKAMEDLEDFQGAHRSRTLARTCSK